VKTKEGASKKHRPVVEDLHVGDIAIDTEANSV
jgi:hypothetical protein